MTPEEVRLEDLKQMAKYDGPIVCFEVREPYYLASCDRCGWVGSTEQCGTDSYGDDSDVYCPRCFTSGADCGKVAAALSHTSGEVTEAMVDAFKGAYRAHLDDVPADAVQVDFKALEREAVRAALEAAIRGEEL